jgi:hypothetical protein
MSLLVFVSSKCFGGGPLTRAWGTHPRPREDKRRRRGKGACGAGADGAKGGTRAAREAQERHGGVPRDLRARAGKDTREEDREIELAKGDGGKRRMVSSVAR